MANSSQNLITLKISPRSYSDELLHDFSECINEKLINDRNLDLELYGQDRSSATNQNVDLVNLQGKTTIGKIFKTLALLNEFETLNDLQLKLRLQIDFSHPLLLEKLDYWQSLGLLSPDTLNLIFHQYLSCRLPIEKEEIPVVTPPEKQKWKVSQPKGKQRPPKVIIPRRPKAPSRLAKMFQSLMAELSVFWLLLLGVFIT